jgi:uncharacterized surface protein with fasciclin (FAS1) repeats
MQVLLNHMVHSQLRMTDLVVDSDARQLTTMAGQKLTLLHDGADITVSFGDEAAARVLASDIDAAGCVLHVVDTVLSPFPAGALPRTRTLEAWAEVSVEQ